MADESNRHILLLLNEGEKTPSEISGNFDFTLPTLSAHLGMLGEADLVSERKAGQKRYYPLNRNMMSEMMRFFDGFWDDSLDRLKRHAKGKR